MNFTRIPGLPAPAALLALLLCLVLPPAQAQDTGLAIREAGSTLVDGVHRVSARIDYRLSREALEALQNGVPLTFEVRVELLRERRFWFDGEVATRVRVDQLSYDALSRSYVVREARSGEQQSFSTLYAALNALGRIQDLALVEDAALDAGESYEAGLRAALDQQRLPGPLRMLAFWQEGLNLESEWYRWTLVR